MDEVTREFIEYIPNDFDATELMFEGPNEALVNLIHTMMDIYGDIIKYIDTEMTECFNWCN